MSKAYDSFKALLRITKNSINISGQEKACLIDDLQFLQKQTMTDEDRRAQESVCREIWKRSLPSLAKLHIVDFSNHQQIIQNHFKFKFQLNNFDIQEFKKDFSHTLKSTNEFAPKDQTQRGFRTRHLGMGYGEHKPIPDRPTESKIREMDKWEALAFFEDLEWRIKKLNVTDKQEKAVMLLSVRYLALEASRARPMRNEACIRLAWNLLKPKLEKYKALEWYKGARTLSGRVKLFISGRY